VHYAYGVFLLAEEPDTGIQELMKELAITPGDLWSMLQLAFEYLKRSDNAQAKTWAEKAAQADPGSFVAHKALGQALLELGDTEGAIKHLERGVQLAKDSPALRFQLAKAYQKAGRTADAQRERAEFVRLDRLVRTSRSGSQAVGGFEPGKGEQNP
jgi:predicted Zn-dependent protease